MRRRHPSYKFNNEDRNEDIRKHLPVSKVTCIEARPTEISTMFSIKLSQAIKLILKIAQMGPAKRLLQRGKILQRGTCSEKGLRGGGRGRSKANLKEGQLVAGALKNFQKLVTRVHCIHQFPVLYSHSKKILQ